MSSQVDNTGGDLLVFADDWGRHPSSCQHLVRNLLARHPVHWVNTIGTRTPRFDMATIRRGVEKAKQWLRRSKPGNATPANLKVLNPRMWPWFSSRFGRQLNTRLLSKQLVPLIQSLPEKPVAITTIPLVADLMDQLPVRSWVYYCVDDFGVWPGLDQSTLKSMETRLIERADVVVAVSEHLQEKLANHGRTAHLLTHGVDLEAWSMSDESVPCPELEGLERPLVVFWGVVDQRMDLAFIQRLAADLQQGTIVLVGPSADPDPALSKLTRVRCIGSVPYEHLPTIARQAAVLVMPYADLPVTRAMQPLKLKEYLATCRPVVASDLPANRPWSDCLDLARTPEDFSILVRQRIESGLPADQQRTRARLTSESWAEKARVFEGWVFEKPALGLTA